MRANTSCLLDFDEFPCGRYLPCSAIIQAIATQEKERRALFQATGEQHFHHDVLQLVLSYLTLPPYAKLSRIIRQPYRQGEKINMEQTDGYLLCWLVRWYKQSTNVTLRDVIDYFGDYFDQRFLSYQDTSCRWREGGDSVYLINLSHQMWVISLTICTSRHVVVIKSLPGEQEVEMTPAELDFFWDKLSQQLLVAAGQGKILIA
jgi:hypothetical protein